jgi:glyoxylase-like metal-dependent hydrolase (beta-lactamase superfamily II)
VPEIDVPLVEGMTLAYGVLTVKVIHTPGHSPGSVCLEIDSELFSGDTIGPDGPGRTDLPGGSAEQMQQSLRRLRRSYPSETLLHPGHGSSIRLGEAA